MLSRMRAALRRSPSGAAASYAWLIVGLGNPGREYEGNRHNIGFMAVDRIAGDYNFGPWKNKYSAEICEGAIEGQRIMLMKPQTYMNLSGKSVAEAARFYKIPHANIIVLHDELDLPLGRVRTKTGGGAAGHNGLKSIDADTGDQNYRRVRLGIGHPGDKARVSGYVLSDFMDKERDLVDILCAAVSRQIELLLTGDESGFMTKISEETKVK